MSAPDLLFTLSSSRFTKKRRWPPRGRIVLVTLVALALLVLGISTWFVFARSTATGPIVGQLAFVSSGQPLTGGLGVADQVQVDLRITQAPAASKDYYAWLLADRTSEQAVLLVEAQAHDRAAVAGPREEEADRDRTEKQDVGDRLCSLAQAETEK